MWLNDLKKTIEKQLVDLDVYDDLEKYQIEFIWDDLSLDKIGYIHEPKNYAGYKWVFKDGIVPVHDGKDIKEWVKDLQILSKNTVVLCAESRPNMFYRITGVDVYMGDELTVIVELFGEYAFTIRV